MTLWATKAQWLAAPLCVGCVWDLEPPLRSAPDGAVADGAVADSAPLMCTVPGASRACYTGARGTQGIGRCHAGSQTCAAGFWGPCEGEAISADEDCNNVDDNCNGAVDDLAPRPCGGGASSYRLSASPQAWIDACAQPSVTVLFVNIDDGAATAPIGFSFDFYGEPQTSVEVSTNGALGLPLVVHDYRNGALPSTRSAAMVLPFWDDLFTRTGVCLATVGPVGSRKLVVEWADTYFYNNRATSSHVTFEVVLSERGGTIDLLYQRMEGEGDRATGSSATIGIQDSSGVLFDQIGFNTHSVVHSGSNLRWTPASTSGVGACRAATQSCRMGAWSVCPTNTMPVVETCDGVDNDCDGVVDDGVVRPCYSGPAATTEIGVCRQGASVCTGGSYGPCRGEILPGATDICSTPFDENCDNTINDHCS